MDLAFLMLDVTSFRSLRYLCHDAGLGYFAQLPVCVHCLVCRLGFLCMLKTMDLTQF